MKKVAIVGVEGSGKTVMLAGLGELYSRPDENGYYLSPKNFGTAAYVSEKIARMRKGEWPSATAGDEMQGLDWTLKQQVSGARRRPKSLCEVSFLDFAGEVYRAAYGISGGENAALAEQVDVLREYVCGADDLIVLINLRDVITNGQQDKRVQEAMWITKAILDTALGDDAGASAPRAAIVLSQADSYAETIRACGGAEGVLAKYLPLVSNNYGWLDILAVSAVDKTVIDEDGRVMPAPDFLSTQLSQLMDWILGGSAQSEGGRAKGNAKSKGGNRRQGRVDGAVPATAFKQKDARAPSRTTKQKGSRNPLPASRRRTATGASSVSKKAKSDVVANIIKFIVIAVGIVWGISLLLACLGWVVDHWVLGLIIIGGVCMWWNKS